MLPLRASAGSTEASNAGFRPSCRKPRFCYVVETLAQPMIFLHRVTARVKKFVAVVFLR